jgi:hypothetical protein
MRNNSTSQRFLTPKAFAAEQKKGTALWDISFLMLYVTFWLGQLQRQ